MSESAYKLFLLFVILIYAIWRVIFSPKFTDLARSEFIIQSLKDKEFDDFKTDRDEKIKIKGRSAHAQWKSHSNSPGSEMLVEFKVHPSTLPISISPSEFIYISGKEHFDQIQKAIQSTGDYTSFTAGTEEIKKLSSK